jgi:hypothetical protein
MFVPPVVDPSHALMLVVPAFADAPSAAESAAIFKAPA